MGCMTNRASLFIYFSKRLCIPFGIGLISLSRIIGLPRSNQLRRKGADFERLCTPSITASRCVLKVCHPCRVAPPISGVGSQRLDHPLGTHFERGVIFCPWGSSWMEREAVNVHQPGELGIVGAHPRRRSPSSDTDKPFRAIQSPVAMVQEVYPANSIGTHRALLV